MIRAESEVGTSRATRAPARSDGFEEVNPDQLRAIVERIERLHEERKALSDDIAEVYAEAKGNGFDTKIIREIVKLRSVDPDKRTEHETLLDLYKSALGMA